MTNKKKNMRNMTLEEAKQEVLEYIRQGMNYRDIAQIEFLINGRVKRFSIGEISKIVKKETVVEQDELKNIDKDISFLFMLFDKGKRPTDIVIEYRLNPDYVQQAYNKYGEMKNMHLFSLSFEDFVYETALNIKGSKAKDLEEAIWYVKDAVGFYFWSVENEPE